MRINKHIAIAYFVFDGAFGNNSATQMVKQCGLDIISKLQKNSALSFPNEEKYKGIIIPSNFHTTFHPVLFPKKLQFL
jgi:hypothetical protein